MQRRDTAIVRRFIDTGMRLGELAGLEVNDVDLDLDVAIITGRGRRTRSAPRARDKHRHVNNAGGDWSR